MHERLQVVWDPALDAGGWPGPLGEASATTGETWLGPLRLLERLELELGLGGLEPTPLARVAALTARLATMPGWWSTSFASDPLGTAKRLLRDRDRLALAGWCGEDVGPRLAALWQATDGLAPGIAERLASIVAALAHRRTGIARISVATPLASLPVTWQALFAALAARGVDVVPRQMPVAGDVDVAKLRLLRSRGVLAAADEVAASLAALPSLDRVVVVGGDAILDAALARHGLPRLGATAAPPASTALVRLVIEAAFEPMEPGDLHALLCLDPGPVPRRVASRLIAALGELPSRRSTAWTEALDEGLARCDDAWREDVRTRLQVLLPAAAPREGVLDVAELQRRLETLARWAHARRSTVPSLAALAHLADDVRALVAATAAGALSLVALRRLCDEVERTHGARQPGEAGLAHVTEPGAVLGPARQIVWWNFTRSSAPSVPRFRLTRVEHAALQAHGIVPPDGGVDMQREAMRWRRPLEHAAEALWLVCPAVAESGEANFPHPLWDELQAAMSPHAAHALECETLPGVARRSVELRALPQPTTEMTIAARIGLRAQESPSSLESLIGCSLRWALGYHGKLYGGLSASAHAPTPLLYGKLAHHVLAQVFGGADVSIDGAAARAAQIVDGELATLCETLSLPRHQLERSTVRQAIVDSARELARLLEASGATVHAVEHELQGPVGDVVVRGIADLLLASPDVVIDLKWGRSTPTEKLKEGTALQLALYAALHGGAATLPQVAYFTLQRQELLVPAGVRLPDARTHGTVTPRETLAGALVTLGERRAELDRGVLRAPAADGTEIAGGLQGTRLSMTPACGYCDYAALCGQGGCA